MLYDGIRWKPDGFSTLKILLICRFFLNFLLSKYKSFYSQDLNFAESPISSVFDFWWPNNKASETSIIIQTIQLVSLKKKKSEPLIKTFLKITELLLLPLSSKAQRPEHTMYHRADLLKPSTNHPSLEVSARGFPHRNYFYTHVSPSLNFAFDCTCTTMAHTIHCGFISTEISYMCRYDGGTSHKARLGPSASHLHLSGEELVSIPFHCLPICRVLIPFGVGDWVGSSLDLPMIGSVGRRSENSKFVGLSHWAYQSVGEFSN